MGVEYVEFDIRRSADGLFVVHHDERIGRSGPRIAELNHAELCAGAGYEVPTMVNVLALLAPCSIAHLDIKDTGHEVDAVKIALDAVGPDAFVASTAGDHSIAAIRALEPKVQTALSLGQRLRGHTRPRARPRPREDCSIRRMVHSGCRWVIINHLLVTGGLLRNCTARGIGVMVWTVNDPRRVRKYLTDNRIDVVITDRPELALSIRAALPS